MRLITGAWFVLHLICSAYGQVTVEVALDQEQFLRDESLPIKLRITNRSGQTLKLGADKDWVTFNVTGRDGLSPLKLGEPSLPESLSIDSAQVATRRIDLMPFYDLSVPGRYSITATVRIAQWSSEVTSSAKEFDIVGGNKVWEQEFGIPTPNGTQPEVRKYILQQATFLKHLRLYVRVTDLAETHTFRVTSVGTLVSFSHPETQVDRASQLHVLFQTGPRSFVYAMLSPDGEVLTRQTHDYANSRPQLHLDEAGQIRVIGGIRRPQTTDLPPPISSRPVPAPARDVPISKP